MLYAHKFFKTEKAAQDFQKKHSGALYSDVPGSRTREDSRVEACVAERSEAERTARPYCVAWNVVDEGPIKPDTLRKEECCV